MYIQLCSGILVLCILTKDKVKGDFMKSKLIYLAVFLLLFLIMLPCIETYAQSGSGYYYLDYFDCYNSEVEKKYLSDTYSIYVSEDETYEYIKIDVDSYGEYDKKILDDSIIYK